MIGTEELCRTHIILWEDLLYFYLIFYKKIRMEYLSTTKSKTQSGIQSKEEWTMHMIQKYNLQYFAPLISLIIKIQVKYQQKISFSKTMN